MSHQLQATVLPKLDNYDEAIDAAPPAVIARAAFDAGHPYEWGFSLSGSMHDAAVAEQICDRMFDGDDTVIEVIAAHPLAVQQIREAAKNGARLIQPPPAPPDTQQVMPNTSEEFICQPALPGGPDVLIVGGINCGGDPFEGFGDVAILAAILSQTLMNTRAPHP